MKTLKKYSKKLRKSVYEVDENMKKKFPSKNTVDALENEIDYRHHLREVIKKENTLTKYPKVNEKLNLLKLYFLTLIANILS